ncbi:MAG: helix-turn-helix domain-containing protein [Candidatus Hodarchaeota archaeon]
MELLNVKETANLLRISHYTLRAWIFARKIPFVRIGRRILFRRSDLEKLVEEAIQPVHTTER